MKKLILRKVIGGWYLILKTITQLNVCFRYIVKSLFYYFTEPYCLSSFQNSIFICQGNTKNQENVKLFKQQLVYLSHMIKTLNQNKFIAKLIYSWLVQPLLVINVTHLW